MNYQILRILVAVFTVNIILKAPVARSRLVLKSHLDHGSELFDEPRNLSKAASICATSTDSRSGNITTTNNVTVKHDTNVTKLV